ncbi:hypothetical protein FSP39_011252 [Pinctada imbricata]|uniref:Uncharacterized protein n=1 Tax=Pinctada imbricata TaxID=66713 RepID=A0AA88YTD9_PINIB|nr:hypothetical protein FSP39_011252 [Pinctada imbricata]
MALTNAERQKRWREKQKEKNKQGFLAKERARKKKTYVSVDKLSKKDLEKRRMAGRKREKKSYYVRKARKSLNNGEKLVTHTRLVVRMPPLKKKYNRALRRANRELEELRQKNGELEKSKRKIQKRCERLVKTNLDSTMNHNKGYSADESSMAESEPPTPLTPRSKAVRDMTKDGLNPRVHSTTRRRLIEANATIAAFSPALRHKKSTKRSNLNVNVDILKKYKCLTSLSRSVGVTRRKMRLLSVKRKQSNIRKRLNNVVTTFLEREDNSVVLPGKKDVSGKQKAQKRILSDYMHNLHKKFELENPSVRISRSSFSKMRSSNMMLACFSSRKTCLCSIHQNMALKLKSIQSKVHVSQNPDVMVQQYPTEESLTDALQEGLTEKVKFRKWKKLNDGEKYRWKEVEEEVKKEEFIDLMKKEVKVFREHVNRVKTQYCEIRKLREKLPEGEVLLWMDFAENYTCSSLEEVQSAYWNASMVSLHTMVVYFPNGDVKSVVGVSDVLSHNATAVITILHKIIPQIKNDYPQLRKIHYLTDSPTSQYRNKTIFQFILEHGDEFGVTAQWNFLESGHGKGPCDGLGASVKRSADMAVRQGKHSIQDANDFLSWARHSEATGSKVTYLYYSQDDYDNTMEMLTKKQQPQPISGTFKLHAVVPYGNGKIATRNTSCYCEKCITHAYTDCGWEIKEIYKSKPSTSTCSTSISSIDDEIQSENLETDEKNPEIGDFVAACYESKWYIGKVLEYDSREKETKINFMEKSGKLLNTFRWPSLKDELWIPTTDILIIIPPPTATGKSSRLFKFDNMVIDLIENQFKKAKK